MSLDPEMPEEDKPQYSMLVQLREVRNGTAELDAWDSNCPVESNLLHAGFRDGDVFELKWVLKTDERFYRNA